MSKLRLRLASPSNGTGLPILNDPVASAGRLDMWERSQKAREFAQLIALVAILLVVGGPFALVGVWAAGLTPLVILIGVGEILAGIVFVAAIVFVLRAPTRPPWDHIDPNSMPKRGHDLVSSAISATEDALSATVRGNGLAEAEVQAATAADLWRVAALCREAQAARGSLRDRLYAAAEDTVQTMQRFANAATAAAASYGPALTNPLGAQVQLDAALQAPPETAALADILDHDQAGPLQPGETRDE
jgi:hypothetical protein